MRDDRARYPRYGTLNIAARWNADPGSCLMKRLFALAAITSAVALSACDDPRPAEPEVMDEPMQEPVTPSIEEVQTPVAAPTATDTLPDNTRSPSETRTSEESVRPDSETLFY